MLCMDFGNERKGLILLALLVLSCSTCLCPCLITNIICVLLLEFIILDFYVIPIYYYFLLWNYPILGFFLFVCCWLLFFFARLRFLLDWARGLVAKTIDFFFFFAFFYFSLNKCNFFLKNILYVVLAFFIF